jgi:hypothetical protein
MAQYHQNGSQSDPTIAKPDLQQQIAGIHAARDEILVQYPDSPAAAETLQRYVDQIEHSLVHGEPVNPKVVAGNDRLLPLQEAVRQVNDERGFSADVLQQHYARLEQAEALRIESSDQLNRVVRLWGGWSGLSSELHQVFSSIHSGIDTGELPGLNADQLRLLGSTLNGELRSVIEQIYTEHGRLLTIPEVQARTLSDSELVEGVEERLRANGVDLLSESARKIGQGSEGTVFSVERTDGTPIALKMKHSADVSHVADAMTVVGAVSAPDASYNVRAVQIYYEDQEICAMELIPEAPDLQTATSYVVNGVVPEDPIDAERVASFVHSYRSSNPIDEELEMLQEALGAALTHLDKTQQRLVGSPEWSVYFGAVENPLTAKPVNFLVSGVTDGKVDLVCIDPR